MIWLQAITAVLSVVGLWHILGIPPIKEWKFRDQFRLDISRVVRIDGEEWIVTQFQARAGEIDVTFEKYEDWVRRMRPTEGGWLWHGSH